MKNITKDWIALENKYCAHNYDPLPVVLCKGLGANLWDIEGKKYIDMMSAYSANSLGHCHPRIVKVLTAQAQTLSLTSRAFYSDQLKPYLEKLCALSKMDMALPMNTGVEAVETAFKAARRWGYEKKGISDNKAIIIVAENNFHGRTITAISASTDPSYKKHFGPLTPGFTAIPFGDAQALAAAITPETCAFIVEPIQGEAGIRIPPSGWLKECEQICKEANVLFIVDEVQSGLGRTGKWFAYEHEAVKPDGLILGKALGGGILPVSVFLAKKAVMDVFTPGSHGSTFGGNPLACRIALEVLAILTEEKLIERSRQLGALLLAELQSIRSDLIKAVRGKGLWVGVEMKQATHARKVCNLLLEKGVLAKEAHDTVIRFAPPFVITEEDIHYTVAQFRKIINNLTI